MTTAMVAVVVVALRLRRKMLLWQLQLWQLKKTFFFLLFFRTSDVKMKKRSFKYLKSTDTFSIFFSK